jgi:hypothetical protein
MDYHGQRTPGEMIERVDGDVVALAEFTVAFLLDVVISILLLVGVIVVVLTVDVRIGGVLLAYCGLVGVGMVRAQRLAASAHRCRAAPSGTRLATRWLRRNVARRRRALRCPPPAPRRDHHPARILHTKAAASHSTSVLRWCSYVAHRAGLPRPFRHAGTQAARRCPWHGRAHRADQRIRGAARAGWPAHNGSPDHIVAGCKNI